MTTLDRAVTGEKLRKLREERKLTQQEVADAIGVTAMAICQYETGERTPRDAVKIALAKFYSRQSRLFFLLFK